MFQVNLPNVFSTICTHTLDNVDHWVVKSTFHETSTEKGRRRCAGKASCPAPLLLLLLLLLLPLRRKKLAADLTDRLNAVAVPLVPSSPGPFSALSYRRLPPPLASARYPYRYRLPFPADLSLSPPPPMFVAWIPGPGGNRPTYFRQTCLEFARSKDNVNLYRIFFPPDWADLECNVDGFKVGKKINIQL